MIVGIGHNYQVGKDTAAEALCRDLGYRKVAFADALRDFVMELDPIVTSSAAQVNIGVGRGRLAWAIQGLGYEEAKRTYPEVRQFLQRTGVAARRMFGEDVWVDAAFRHVTDDSDRIVFSDVRFPNEAERIRFAGGLLIKVVRPGYEGDDHESETALRDFDWDHVVNNNGSVMDLQREIVRIVRDEIGRREIAKISDDEVSAS